MSDYVNFTFQTLKEEVGKNKTNKKILGMPAWKDITRENHKNYIKKEHKGHAILTGKISGITIFDFDIPEVYYKFVELYPKLKSYKTIKTKNGFHVYCNYDEDIKTTTDGFINDKGVDIRNDDAIVFAPPCQRILLNGDIFTYEDLGGDILPVPEIFVDNMKQLHDMTDNDSIASNEIVSSISICAADAEYIKEAIEKGWLNDMANASYDEWRNVGFAIKHTLGDQGRQIFHEFSKINEKYDNEYTNKFWDTIKQGKKPLTLGSIKYWVRQYKDKDKSEFEKILEKTESNDYDIANTINLFKNIKYSHHNKTWYIFDNKWNSDISGAFVSNLLSNEFWDVVNNYLLKIYAEKNELDEDKREYHVKLLFKLSDIRKALKKTSKKKNIMTELKCITQDEDFRIKMNRQKNLLPLKNNKIINLLTNEVRPITINDYFDYECPVSFLELTEEQEKEMKTYFEDLFSGDVETTQCFLDIIKSCVTGETHRYVYFWIGNGSNGKSLILSLIQKMFSKGADVISKDVILKKKGNTHLSTELEKLDKTRFGFVTELTESDVLNEPMIKAISGSDPINVRGICKTDETIYPTANINIITNKLPTFEVEKAICNRIVMFPFTNVFENSTEFKEKMESKIDLVFSYMMKRGVVKKDFVFTEKMLEKSREYKENNKTDFLEEFINEKCNHIGSIKRDDFIIAFNKWCEETGKEDKIQVTFSKRMTKLGFGNKKSNSIVYFTDISLKSELT